MEYQVLMYVLPSGKCPYNEWFEHLKDRNASLAIDDRVDRLRYGNFGVAKPVGAGVYELVIDLGPGYRVYYSKVGAVVVLLLCGGDKSGQQQDIDRAKMFLKDYKIRTGHDKKS